MGSEAAARELADAPECPIAVEHVVRWARTLNGRSGYVEGRALPLAYDTVGWWAYLTKHYPTPYEVEGIMMLDAAINNPDQFLKEDPEEEGAEVAGVAATQPPAGMATRLPSGKGIRASTNPWPERDPSIVPQPIYPDRR